MCLTAEEKTHYADDSNKTIASLRAEIADLVPLLGEPECSDVQQKLSTVKKKNDVIELLQLAREHAVERASSSDSLRQPGADPNADDDHAA